MRYDDDDDRDIPPPMSELEAPEERAALPVLEPVRVTRPVGSLGTHLLAAAAGALLGALALVAAATLYGAWEQRRYEELVQQVEVRPAPAPAPPTSPAPRGLRAIDGKAVAFVPTGRVQLVNVWLEGCADCMPSFEAWKRHVAEERIPSGVPISNVAYVRASEDYARRYRVDEGLVVEEFERAKASWLGREAIHLQGVRELALTAAIDELVGLGWDHYRKTPATVASLTRDRVREAAERHLREDNRVIVRLSK